jgi:diguanylate cyclase (GGDEF)-like protein
VIEVGRQRKRLFAVLAALLLAAFVLSMMVSYVIARDTIRKNIVERELPLTGDSIYSEIQRDVIKPVFVSDQMAHNTYLREWVIAGEGDTEQLTRYLKEVKERYGAFTAFFASEGTLRYYNHEGFQRTLRPDEARDKWFFRVRKMTDLYESNIDPDITNKNAITVFINYRLLDANQKFLGTTGIGLSSSSLSKLIEQYETKFQRQITFCDRKGNIMLVDQTNAVKPKTINDVPGLKELTAKILNGSSVQTKLSYVHDDQTGGLTHVNSRFIPELNWYLLVEQNEKQALAPLSRVLYWNALIALLATAGALMLVWLAVNRYQRRLQHLAAIDSLTGLSNRPTGEAAFQRAILDAGRRNEPLSVAVVDIDRFKTINDIYGHQAGDHVISEFARRLRSAARADDALIRWGGEEFLVLFRGATLEKAIVIAEDIRREVSSGTYSVGRALIDGELSVQSDELKATISIGVAQWDGIENSGSLFARADRALMNAKNTGRDRVVTAAVPLA